MLKDHGDKSQVLVILKVYDRVSSVNVLHASKYWLPFFALYFIPLCALCIVSITKSHKSEKIENDKKYGCLKLLSLFLHPSQAEEAAEVMKENLDANRPHVKFTFLNQDESGKTMLNVLNPDTGSGM